MRGCPADPAAARCGGAAARADFGWYRSRRPLSNPWQPNCILYSCSPQRAGVGAPCIPCSKLTRDGGPATPLPAEPRQCVACCPVGAPGHLCAAACCVSLSSTSIHASYQLGLAADARPLSRRGMPAGASAAPHLLHSPRQCNSPASCRSLPLALPIQPRAAKGAADCRTSLQPHERGSACSSAGARGGQRGPSGGAAQATVQRGPPSPRANRAPRALSALLRLCEDRRSSWGGPRRGPRTPPLPPPPPPRRRHD